MNILNNRVEWKFNEMGRGGYAKCDIKNGALIHKAPIILLSPEEHYKVKDTELVNHIFVWDEDDSTPLVIDGITYESVAICLGLGTIFNHSYEPNAYYLNNPDDNTIEFYAIRDIEAGEEVYTNYNGESDSLDPLNYDWFDESMIPKPTINIKLPKKNKKNK